MADLDAAALNADARRIYAATPPMSREMAAARLAANGIEPGPDGSVLAVPKLSPASLEAYRAQLANKDFAEKYPEQHAALKASVDAALAHTKQSLEP
jgi:hypothetical protein